ncbi:MAG: hypothetical protein WAL35_00965 [Acidimicrobiales bacterium]
MRRTRFDYNLLDDKHPFELDEENRPHLVKHETFSEDDLWDVWTSDPVFLPAAADGDADWLMVAEVAGNVLVVPLAPPDSGDVTKARPIGIDLLKNPVTLDQYFQLR